MTRPLFRLLLAGLALAPFAPTQQDALRAGQQVGRPLADDRQQGAAAVTVADCDRWLHKLASAEFAGRGTGQEGYRKAAAFVAAHFEALGLEARGADGTYYQHVPWTSSKVTKATLTFTKDGQEVLAIPADRLTGTASKDAAASGDVVLLNVEVPPMKGRRMPEIAGLDDLDVAGKVVVAMVRADRRTLPFARYAVMSGLQGKDAAAFVFANHEAVEGGMRSTSGMSRRGRNPAAAAARNRPLDVNIGGADVEKLLGFANLTTESVAQAPILTEMPLAAKVEVAVESADAPAMNVWAVLPGSDPKLKDEYVVIGSHLDHLGERGGRIYPGADDDGSGTTGVLAVAQMFAKNPTRPKRSILFVCFSAEENGLVGSRYFVQNCPVPLSSIAAELQMDMIGRSEEESRDGGRLVNKGETAEDNRNVIHLVGTQKMSSALHELCMARNETAGFDIEFDQESLFTRSDHANFAYQGVPIAFFFTGIHKDYHKTTDTPDKIDYPKLLRIARYVYDIGYEVADAEQRPMIDPELWAKFKKTDRRGRMPDEPAAPVNGGK
ncbi:MAG: M20/M25/M40 family metallo-hydrolase [Planctomycetes bacterium]|nr:M20/M25/M40 family metallo-hydrolase [Planctomycetota bacterium]